MQPPATSRQSSRLGASDVVGRDEAPAGLAAQRVKLREAVAARGRVTRWRFTIARMGVHPRDKSLAVDEQVAVAEAVLRVPSASRDDVKPVRDT